ncbi:MAG TPA: hypothetical protein VLC98_02260 [Phnomibacter sp.]|nr:hypothetical protein [Phnomibacter sp.]
MKRTINTIAGICKTLLTLACMAVFAQLQAQDTVKRKTIDITSSFKPSLRPQQKMGFTASAVASDTNRPKLSYKIPAQNLAFGFYPAPLRPLAFQADSATVATGPSIYLKAGFGNFTTPYFKGIAAFGDGKKSNGNVEAQYIGSKGKLEYQDYEQYGVKGNLWLHMKQNNTLHLNGGFLSNGTYQYGFDPKTVAPPKDSLRIKYSDVFVGADMGNIIAGDAGVSYQAKLNAHFFSDNKDGQETSVHFDVPITKTISDNASVTLGIKGMLSTFSGATSDFSNNLFMIPVNGKFKLQENMTLKAGLIPSWNNKQFKLLPDIDFEYLLNEKNLVLQAGFRGYFDEQNYRSLTVYNPWIQQPDSLTNTRNSEIFGAVKSNLNENFSFRVKLGVGSQFNVPLLVNDQYDGRTFELINEKKLSHILFSGELVYQKGDKISWTNLLQYNGYGDIEQAPKAYGLLPFEFRSSLQFLIRKDLRFKADMYAFNGAWYRTVEGDDKRGKSVIDLNAGVEFDVTQKLKLWLQFNNITNSEYQRWHQYQALGFQAVGGIIFHM